VDKWLARMALQTEVRGSLTVVLRKTGRSRKDPSEFRKGGGEFMMETAVGGDG
jgi:hypothetical protein